MAEPGTTVRYPRRQTRAIAGGILWTLLFPIAFASIGKLVGMIFHMPHGPPTWLGEVLLGGVGVGLVTAALVYRAARAARGSVRREGDKILVERAGRTREIPLERVDSGWISKEPPSADRLGLSLVGGELIDVTLPTGTGAATLEALGLDASKRRLHVSIWRTAESVLMTFAGAVLGLLAWAPVAGIGADVLGPARVASPMGTAMAFATLIPMMIGGAALLRRTRPEVTIGSDGVRVTGGSIRKNERFYPLDRIVDVHVAPIRPQRGNSREMGVLLELRKGERGEQRETVTIASFVPVSEKTPPFAEVIEARIREAMAARDAAAPAEASALLDVTSGGVGAWIASLRKLAGRTDGYRAGALTKDRLLELVGDVRAKMSHRIGAAVVLAERGDPDGLERVRIAADASASPRVRVALETVANRSLDEEAIAEAIHDEAAEAEAPAEAAAQGKR